MIPYSELNEGDFFRLPHDDSREIHRRGPLRPRSGNSLLDGLAVRMNNQLVEQVLIALDVMCVRCEYRWYAEPDFAVTCGACGHSFHPFAIPDSEKDHA